MNVILSLNDLKAKTYFCLLFTFGLSSYPFLQEFFVFSFPVVLKVLRGFLFSKSSGGTLERMLEAEKSCKMLTCGG